MTTAEGLWFTRADWMDDASCAGMSPELFFPEREAKDRTTRSKIERLRALCAACPVQRECLEYAVDNNIYHGWWGGKSPKERRVVRRRLR